MTQRDQFVAAMLSRVGYRYHDGPTRCTGADGYFDCSGLQAFGLVQSGARPAGYCGDSATMAADVHNAGTVLTRDQARATRGAWAIRSRNNSIIPGVGHIVCSLGDGRTVEAHSTASGVIVGTFDGNRQFSTFGTPPGVEGFGTTAAPVVIAPGVGMGWKLVSHPHSTTANPGYWTVDDAGHVYAYGIADYHGGQGAKLPSGATVNLNGQCTSFDATPSGDGYLMITDSGSIYAFGDATRTGDPHGDPAT